MIKILPAAKLDETLTAYCNECFRTFVTIEFISLVNHSFSAKSPDGQANVFHDEKLEYAVGLFNTLYHLPLTTNDAEVRKTLSYYLSSPFNLLILPGPDSQSKLAELRKLAQINRKEIPRQDY